MDMFWLYDLSNITMGCVIVSFFVSMALLGLLAGRRFFTLLHDEARGPHNDVVSYYLSAIGAIYGITIGLLAAGTWSNFSDVEEAAIAEAAAMAALYRDVSSLPLPHRTEMQDILRDTAHFIIEKQWPAHQQGKVLPNTDLTRFQIALVKFQPQNQHEEILYAEAYHQFNVYAENRRVRISHVTSGLPGVLWAVVLIGAALTIGVVWFFQIKNFRLHAAMTVILSGLIGLLVFIIAAMDWPYRGEFSVQPDAMQGVLDTVMDTRLLPEGQIKPF